MSNSLWNVKEPFYFTRVAWAWARDRYVACSMFVSCNHSKRHMWIYSAVVFTSKWCARASTLPCIQLNAIPSINSIMYEPLKDNVISKCHMCQSCAQLEPEPWNGMPACSKAMALALLRLCLGEWVGCYSHDLTVSHILHKVKRTLSYSSGTYLFKSCGGTRHVPSELDFSFTLACFFLLHSMVYATVLSVRGTL